MFENEIVIHKTFGRSKVLMIDNVYLKALFESGKRTLNLKMVLEKSLLAFENKDIQEKMVYEYIVKPQELIKHQDELKQKEKEEENRAKCELLKKLKEFGFEGFLHTTDMDNFKNIIVDGVLKSRKQALDEGSLVTNSAEQDVIDKTTDYVQNSCRFYYYFKTPTNYVATSRGYYRRPVILVFDEDIINLENAWFSSKNAVYSSGHTQSAKTALTFEWDAIFERGSYNNSKYWDNNRPEDEMKSAITAVRNAEFLIKGTVDISYIKKIYFKFETDMEEAKTFCPNDIVEKFVFDRSKFDIC